MTLTLNAPVKEQKKVTVPADTAADVQLSVAEKDTVIQVAADSEETPTVPGENKGERRAWSQPRPEERVRFSRD